MIKKSKSLKNVKAIKYNFYFWGPFLFRTKITSQECQMILEEGKKCRKKSNDYRATLAGHLSEEYTLGGEEISIWLKKYFEAYAVAYNKWRGFEKDTKKMKPNFRLKSLWINYMKAGEFNPPHDHSGDLSFVIYPDIPNQLIQENKTYVGTTRGPGSVCWIYGEGNSQCISVVRRLPETGDLVIFPSSLKHWVFPFKSNVERVSVSGNILFEKTSRPNSWTYSKDIVGSDFINV